MREVSCYFCGSSRAIIVDKQEFHDEYLSYIDTGYLSQPRYWKSCESCGGVYHSPALDESDIHRLYVEKYRQHSLRDELSPDEFFDKIMSLPREASENWEKVAWLSPIAAGMSGGDGQAPALLDVGCSAGMFIKLFLDDNPAWTGAGIEPTERFAETAARRLSLPVKAGQYQSGLFGRRFELITVIHVLEHLVDPRRFLSQISDDIAPGGLLYLEVPDLTDFRNLPPNHDRFMSPHLYYFSPNSLGRLLDETGWKIIHSDTYLGKRGHANLRMACTQGKVEQTPDSRRDDPHAILALRNAWTGVGAL